MLIRDFRPAHLFLVMLTACLWLPSAVWGQVKSIEEAVKLSQATGRPIFAMAGKET